MEKSIIIIGGGLSGLAVGCYGRMNGYKTKIFEMHDIVGGVCTGWKRKGYTIDGAMNWLVGTGPKSSAYKLWEELGAAKHWKIYNHDLYSVYEDKDGKAFNIYCDADRFEKYLLEIAPEDKDIIKEFTKGIRDFSRTDMPVGKPNEIMTWFSKITVVKMLPMLMLMKKWLKISAGDFFKRLKNPYLRQTLTSAFGGDQWPMMIIFWMLGFQHAKAAGYVLGGALEHVRFLEERYRALGGAIHCKSKVVKILVENDKAIGIKLADGTEHRADWIVSAADGRTTIFDLLEGKYIDDAIKKRYDNPNLFSPLVYIGLGVADPVKEIPPAISGLSFPLETPITVAGKERRRLDVRTYSYDPAMAPQGKTVLITQFDTDYDYWEKLHKEPEKYEAEKEKIADLVVSLLDKRYPGLASKVEMRDVATPVTWVRYTGNWRGSYEGWQFSAETFTGSMKKTLPGLDNFYMAGQWVNPGGGMPTAAMSGNHTIQLICHRDKKKFITARP
ncbi:MAG: NAD(P)/FAD-dependent oxidoreductase [Dehalococcoidales bacterium]|nr:NAD(P)/FAD-dependent oxidoreductase [Dehalococcoidales bacterium]